MEAKFTTELSGLKLVVRCFYTEGIGETYYQPEEPPTCEIYEISFEGTKFDLDLVPDDYMEDLEKRFLEGEFYDEGEI